MNALELLVPWLMRHRRRLGGAVLLAVITVLAGVGLFSVAGWFLTWAFLAGASIAFDLFAPSALVRGLSFIRIGSRYAERVAGHAATLDLLADIRTSVFASVMALSPVQLADYRDGDLVSRLIGDIDALDTMFLLIIAPVLTAMITGAAFAVVVGAYVPLLAVAVFAALLMGIVVVPYCLARWSRRAGAEVQTGASEVRALVHDTVAGHVDIAAFGAQARTASQFHQEASRLGSARDRVAAIGACGQFAQQVVVGVCVLAMLWLGLQAFNQGLLAGPVWVGLLLGAIGLFEVLGPLMRGAARLGATAEGARRVRTVFTARPAVGAPAAETDLPESGDIVLRDVGFQYRNGSLVLDRLNLRVGQGERVAIVGASGAGKSTLLSLLLRIVDPTHGSVSFGKVALNHANLAQLHCRMALLSQFSPVFLGTVRDNLLIGNGQASDEQLWQALQQARLAEFVRSLADGLDAWVAESGHNWSVGQTRRLCLARTLLAPACVWVLDEPTAGLDETTQKAFFDDLARAAGARTVILATHANFPATAFDRAYRLEGGVLEPDTERP